VENIEIARTLSDYAALLDIQGESPFRVRAYRQAAQAVEELLQPVTQILREGGDLTALPGVGDRMAAHIQEIVETGTLLALEQTQKDVPQSLAELIKLETLGPKKAKQLYERLGVTSVSGLKDALDAGAVEKLPGFGPKTVERLRHAVTEAAGQARRFKPADAAGRGATHPYPRTGQEGATAGDGFAY
jgi:DNA polymerase (family X)